MSYEIVHTSVPSGLRTGAKGYCTVGATKGIAPHVLTTLEALTGYRWIHRPAGDPRNPVIYSHLLLKSGESVLSRICDAGLDYSKRENKLSHLIVLNTGERPGEGPARAMAHADTFFKQWKGEPRHLPFRTILADAELSGPCQTWKQLTGDTGWAAALAETAQSRSGRDAYIIYSEGTDCLRLIDEALSLLAPEERWKVTFSTFFTKNLLHHGKCQWRFIQKGQGEEKSIPPSSHAFVLDLTDIRGKAHDTPLANQARTGVRPQKKVEKAETKVPVELGFKEPKAQPSRSQPSSRGVPQANKQPGSIPMLHTNPSAEQERPGADVFSESLPAMAPPAPPDQVPKKKPRKRNNLLSNVLVIPVLLAFLAGCFLGLFTGIGAMLVVSKVNDQSPLAANMPSPDDEAAAIPQPTIDNSLPEKLTSESASKAEDGVDEPAEASEQAEEIGTIQDSGHVPGVGTDNESDSQKGRQHDSEPIASSDTVSTNHSDSDVEQTEEQKKTERLKLLVGKNEIELPFVPDEYFYFETPFLNKTKLTEGQHSNILQIPTEDRLSGPVDVLKPSVNQGTIISPLPDFESRKKGVYWVVKEANKALFFFEDEFAVDVPNSYGPKGKVVAKFDLPKFECVEISFKPKFEKFWKLVPPQSTAPANSENAESQQQTTELKIESYLTVPHSAQPQTTPQTPPSTYSKITGSVKFSMDSKNRRLTVETETGKFPTVGKPGLEHYEQVKQKIIDNPIKLNFFFKSVEIEGNKYDVHWEDFPLILNFSEDTPY